MNQLEHAKESCEKLDAELFAGDNFHSHESLDQLDDYLARWQRRAKELRDWMNEV